MKRIPFESQTVENGESVMFVSDLAPAEIRFKHNTKEIFIIYEGKPAYDGEDLAAMNWRRVKELVVKEGGKWTSKKKGIEFLLEVPI